MTKTVNCPTCGNPVPWVPASRWRPFCSERCRLIDLGEWLAEGRLISEPVNEGDEAPPAKDRDHNQDGARRRR